MKHTTKHTAAPRFARNLLTFSQGLYTSTSARVYRGTTAGINIRLNVVVDLLTMTHVSAFETESKWKKEANK